MCNTGWNDKIVTQEKTTWFHFRLMKTGFLFCCRPFTLWPVVYKSQVRYEPSIMSERDTMFNELDHRCVAVQLMLSTDPVMTTGPLPAPSKCKSGLPLITGTCSGWWKQRFRLRLWSLVWFQVRATWCHLTSSKSAWKSTLKCTWMCWRVWWAPGAIRWPVTDPECGSRTRRRPTSPKRPRLGFRRNATTLYPHLTGPLLPRPEPTGLLRLVICREHHQHDLQRHQSQPDHRHPPSIRRAPAGACRKGMLRFPDLYQGGDWDWRRLHWIDISSTT